MGRRSSAANNGEGNGGVGYVLGEGPDAVIVSSEEAKVLRRLSVLAGFERVWTTKAVSNLFRGIFGRGGADSERRRKRKQRRKRHRKQKKKRRKER